MAIDDTDDIGSYVLNSPKSSHSDEAEDRAEHWRISEDGGIEDLKFTTFTRSSREKMASWVGQPSVKGSTEGVQMALLTLTTMGVQLTWGVEMTYCTPYLLQLGLSKSRTSLVWIAGPLSGLIMQPIVGVVSDRCTSKYGRRRPFMVVGSIAVAACLLILGWTKEIVSTFVAEGEFAKTCMISLAVSAIYAVDFSINAVMSCSRSLVVDTLPIPKQQKGAAWSSRMVSLGHLAGYAVGTLDLVQLFGTSFGDTQFKKLILFAAFGLLFTVGITCWAVTERVLVSRDDDSKSGIVKIVDRIYQATKHLPPRIQAICWIQFWSWIGWFPFLFYSTTWVGETYFRYDAPHDANKSSDTLGDIGRIGSMALVVSSFITFIAAFLLPLVIKSPEEKGFTKRPPAAIAKLVTKVSKYQPDLITAWICGHLMFSSAMILAPFAHSFKFATALVAFCGLPWMLASWAPNTFMGMEVNRLSSPTTNRRGSFSGHESIELLSPYTPHSSRTPKTPMTPSLLLLEAGSGEAPVASTGELSGLYFGILNIYTTLPQFIGTFISMIVFSILEPGKSPEFHSGDKDTTSAATGPNGIAVCLFIGALSNIGAAWATKKLKDLP